MATGTFKGWRQSLLRLETYYKSTGKTVVSESASTSSSVTITTSNDKTGSPLPSWRRRIRLHQDATTVFVANRDVVRVKGRGQAVVTSRTETSSQVQRQTYKHSGIFQFPLGFPSISSSTLNKAEDIALDKIRRKIQQTQKQFEGGTFLGEIRQTLSMLKHPAKGVQNYLKDTAYSRYKKALKKAVRQRGRRIPVEKARHNVRTAVSDTWLEVQFGLRPFISDIQGAAKAVAHLNNKVEYIPVRSSHSYESSQSYGVVSSPTIPGVLQYDITKRLKLRSVVSIYGEIRNNFTGAPHNFGVDPLKDFIPTVWELIPYSFLVDYFVNVGEVLDGAFIDYGSIRRMSVSRSNLGQFIYTFDNFRGFGDGPYEIANGSHPPVTVEKRHVERLTPYPISAPRLQFHLPMGGFKIANMAALIGSKYRGLSRNTAKSVLFTGRRFH